MAFAIRTGVTVLDFRHDAHHSLLGIHGESNIFTSKTSKAIVTTIETSIMINASQERVWEIVSDIDNEPKFWKGTKEVHNFSREGNITNREIIIAFRDQKCQQEVTLYPKEKVVAIFTKGIINGSKTISLKGKDHETEIDVIWDVKLSGVMGMFTGMIKKHIKDGTDLALQNIKTEIEN